MTGAVDGSLDIPLPEHAANGRDETRPDRDPLALDGFEGRRMLRESAQVQSVIGELWFAALWNQ
jgi:hypothetical protein